MVHPKKKKKKKKKKNPDGTTKNALDISNNIMSGKPVKR